MLDPAHYPDPSFQITHLETHISHVFLCDGFVYKIKKPVAFGFLDFTSLSKRHFFCRQEVKLNSRLAGDTYLGVMPIYQKGEEYSFSKPVGGRIAEYAVKMRKIPMECLLFSLIEQGRPLFGRLGPVGRTLAGFHRGARVYKGVRYGGLEAIRKAAEENFAQIDPYRGETIESGLLEQLISYTGEFLAEKKEHLEMRRSQGFVREGHGDLHTQHICLSDPPIIFDCIEFNESFRVIDVLEDIAFLFMDMEYRARFDLSSAFYKTYFTHNQESMDDELLRFYKIYRAVVRGKVEGFRARGLTDREEKEKSLRDAGEYFHLADYYLNNDKRPFNPIVFMGLSGAGKSAIARDFSDDRTILRSDEIRKAMEGLSPGEHRYAGYGEGIYSEALTREVYCTLLEKMSEYVQAGKSVVVDATFLKKSQRRNFYETCIGKGFNPFFIHCFAEEGVLKDRIRRRMEEGKDASDADIGVLERQIRNMEEPVELPYYRILRLNTEEKLHNIIEALKQFL